MARRLYIMLPERFQYERFLLYYVYINSISISKTKSRFFFFLFMCVANSTKCIITIFRISLHTFYTYIQHTLYPPINRYQYKYSRSARYMKRYRGICTYIYSACKVELINFAFLFSVIIFINYV